MSRQTSPPADAPAHRYTAALADQIETHWQRVWEEQGTFRQPNPGEPGFDAAREKYYVLDMFPYPSGAGLHVGHPEGYTATDIVARFMRMQGRNVLHPMGWDAFGLPAEQYAIATGIHPAETTKTAIDNFRRQLKRFGFSYDWSREFGTIDPDYYKWTQWIFLRLYDSWFDVEAARRDEAGDSAVSAVKGRARPISDLVAEFESGVGRGGRTPRLNPRAAEYAGAGDLPDGTNAGPWETLDEETRRAIIDSYRLAYVSLQTVNWCPKLGTALANEEVIDGKSERGGFPVFRKPLRQWMLRITAYADRLLEDLGRVDWPDSTRTMQREWIGRSEGAEIDFPILDDSAGERGEGAEGNPSGESLRVFTTRPDTIFGATYMVVAPEHPLVELLEDMGGGARRETDVAAVMRYVREARNRSDVERQESKEKTGVFTGVYVRNPATGERIPVWVADYVLMGYGTGAIMAVPAQDERDWAFAEKFGLPIVRTVQPPAGWDEEKAYTGDGPAINSEFLDGLHVGEAKERIIAWLEKNHAGMRRVNYRLRDWLFSRQRYWGEPFPIVYDRAGRHFPVSEGALPVKLPPLEDYAPEESDEPRPLLAKAAEWVKTTAGEAGVDPALLDPAEPVMRETNTMPGWAGSCWYYLRYCDARNGERFVSREAESYWMGGRGVDLYVGGAEHAVLHLLYARFWHKVLYDLGEVGTAEPFAKLFHQGLITSYAYQRADKSLVPIDAVDETAEGAYVERATGEPVKQIVAKMSKSLKNVVNPDDIIADYGADTFRLYEMYLGPLEASKPWNTRDIVGLFRFLQRAWRLIVDEETGALRLVPGADEGVERQLHRTIAKVADDIPQLRFNTAIAALIEFVNVATSAGGVTQGQAERFALTLAPFAPHIAEELWSRLGRTGSVAYEPFPPHDFAMLTEATIEVPVQISGKVKARIDVPAEADAAAMEAAALADPRVQELLAGKAVKKVIAVPGRLINIVA